MFKRDWIHTINTFLVNTDGSTIKALSLFTDTHAKLENEVADPDIAVMFSEFDPVFQSYTSIYSHWETAQGTYHGGTASLEDLFEQLPEHIRKWEGGVRYVFVEDSPTEIAIFPNKRTPFFQRTYEKRIMAVRSLSEKLLEFPALSATQLSVASFYNLLESTRLTQQQEEGGVKQQSDLLENQRIIVCKVLYGVLGLLMRKYRDNPTEINRYFDLTLLRQSASPETPEEPAPDAENPA